MSRPEYIYINKYTNYSHSFVYTLGHTCTLVESPLPTVWPRQSRQSYRPLHQRWLIMYCNMFLCVYIKMCGTYLIVMSFFYIPWMICFVSSYFNTYTHARTHKYLWVHRHFGVYERACAFARLEHMYSLSCQRLVEHVKIYIYIYILIRVVWCVFFFV